MVQGAGARVLFPVVVGLVCWIRVRVALGGRDLEIGC